MGQVMTFSSTPCGLLTCKRFWHFGQVMSFCFTIIVFNLVVWEIGRLVVWEIKLRLNIGCTIFVSFGLPFHDNHLVVKLSPHNGVLFVVSILEYVLVHIFIEFLCGNLAIAIIVGTTFQRTL